MRRRDFIAGLGGGLVARPTGSRAQGPGRVYRLGHLSIGGPSEPLTYKVTLAELAKLGFVEGRNLIWDPRSGTPEQLPGLVAELLDAKPDAIIASGEAAISVAAAATRTVPIVGFGGDVVKLGLAQSYARPGGNVTGVVIIIGDLDVKRLSILRETVPDRRRVAALVSATQRELTEAALRAAAQRLGAELLVFAVSSPSDYGSAFAAMRTARIEALLVCAAPEFSRDVEEIARLAIEARLPSTCQWADMARAGCLVGYGPDRTALRRRMADQIAQILRGTPPGEVAVEWPTLFEFAVNQKTAKTLGITIPFSVLASADEVIE